MFSRQLQNLSRVCATAVAYQGTVNSANNIANFLGIRYAAPPVGDLRFRAPQPPANMSGVQLATAQPNACLESVGGQSPANPFETSAAQIDHTEDCLFLNVYYPSDGVGTPPKNLPTVVWIHGGYGTKFVDEFVHSLGMISYVGGAASGYNGEDIIGQSNSGVVVVVIQYRLGVFGFLAGSAVQRDGALNAGLLDQDFALRRVNRHISKFGGDPSKATIWGESAGAGSVLQQVVANGGKTEPQLFRAAITSSTFLPSQYQFNDHLTDTLNFDSCATAEDSMACLRAVDATVLEAANTNISSGAFFGTFVFVPVVDGVFITQRPTISLLEGKVNGEALLAVTNAFEGNSFVDQSVSVSAAQYSLNLFPRFSTLQAATVSLLYAGLGSQLFQVNAGEFAIPPGLHGHDLAYYFPGSTPPPFNNKSFIDAFAQSFTSFIINLSPNIKVDPTTITPHWNTFDIQHTEMLFNQTSVDGLPVVHSIATSDALLGRCGFWNSVGSLTAQ
ncbi:Alpha/Beta hydrolase protein [Mycena latifolia]|nr:Alpha/Beta hydrolase protein [Mycena latifolia]